MMVLITYDVETITPSGAKRLRQVAKICKDYGQRVQNSVFECVLSESDLLWMKDKIAATIDPKCDSVRFYRLGKNWEQKLECIGKVTSYNVEECLIV